MSDSKSITREEGMDNSKEHLMNIEVAGTDEFLIDDNEFQIKYLTSELLEKFVSLSLEGKVAYTIEGDSPIASFFSTLREGTKEGSELRKLYDESVSKGATETTSTMESSTE